MADTLFDDDDDDDFWGEELVYTEAASTSLAVTSYQTSTERVRFDRMTWPNIQCSHPAW